MPFTWIDNGVYTRYTPNISSGNVQKIHSPQKTEKIQEHLEKKQGGREKVRAFEDHRKESLQTERNSHGQSKH
ncbi:MAG: hypothetical protein AAF518_12940 [Spirochaetota bacterium]